MPILSLEGLRTAVPIASVELLRCGPAYLLSVRDADGAQGLALCNQWAGDLRSLLLGRIGPFFVGRDARDIERLIDEVYRHAANYKLAGMAFWGCVAYVELAILDLLGKRAGVPVCDLLGGRRRESVPVYLSSLRRDTTAEQEVSWLAERLTQTGCRAVKIKIGGRMSGNADAAPGRTEALVRLARRTFGEGVAVYADANGSYDAARAVEIGRFLEDQGVALFEEPCPWEQYEQTRQVAEALTMAVSGGEQDSSLPRFGEMIERRVVDVLQPDVQYCGGLIRACRIAAMAEGAGIGITPHSPKADPTAAYMLHLVARTPNVGAFHEYRADGAGAASWFSPSLEARNGCVTVPTGPGLGIDYDEAFLAQAQPVTVSS